ncbi:hypothetical protein BPAE_0003g00180 [Botrytis paeoniae]|uniref:Uncharacterized protein n=1 Tax=Botrytis paeoniae TaxID=278948 RepID=A0A4Z1G4Z9_9HELO|nr:hypothetical protein BPAE_0003g00180 [Botrytis paeoniae]
MRIITWNNANDNENAHHPNPRLLPKFKRLNIKVAATARTLKTLTKTKTICATNGVIPEL